MKGKFAITPKKWFDRDEDYSPEQKIQKANAFFSDSALVPDLRSNPLMLGLMCNLYRVEGYIPRNRPEVYGKCSIMLFERWDKSRDILVPLPFEEHIRPAMQDLAYWIYSNEELQGGVTEHDLIERTADYLCRWVFDDPHKAKFAACDFIRFCTGRAWVFTDTGTTREGERLFQFTHRTFLEYFTACYIVSVHPTPESLVSSLIDRIKKGEWDVVAQLAFQIQNKQVHGAADELLSLLLAAKPTDQPLGREVLSFAVRSLEFLVPTPRVRRDVARSALSFWLSVATTTPENNGGEARDSQMERAEEIGRLLRVAPENRDTIANETQIFLSDCLTSTDRRTAEVSAELVFNLTRPLLMIAHRRVKDSDLIEYWANVSNQIIKSMIEEIHRISKYSALIAGQCYWRNLIPLQDGIDAFGIKFLLASFHSGALGQVWYYPVGYRLVDAAFGTWPHEVSLNDRNRIVSDLAGLADLFLRAPLPWIQGGHNGHPSRHFFYLYNQQGETPREPIDLSQDAQFAGLCILAAGLEQTADSREQQELKARISKESNLQPDIKLFLLGRLGEQDATASSLKVLETLSLTPIQREFLRAWVTLEIDLVKKTYPRKNRSF